MNHRYLVFVCLCNHCFLQVQCFLLPPCKTEQLFPLSELQVPVYAEFHVGTVIAGLQARPNFTWASGYRRFCSVGSVSQTQSFVWSGVWHLPGNGYLMSIGNSVRSLKPSLQIIRSVDWISMQRFSRAKQVHGEFIWCLCCLPCEMNSSNAKGRDWVIY